MGDIRITTSVRLIELGRWDGSVASEGYDQALRAIPFELHELALSSPEPPITIYSLGVAGSRAGFVIHSPNREYGRIGVWLSGIAQLAVRDEDDLAASVLEFLMDREMIDVALTPDPTSDEPEQSVAPAEPQQFASPIQYLDPSEPE